MKDLLIVLLSLAIVVSLLLALPTKTVTDTPWLAAALRPFAALFGLSQTELLDTPLADTASITGAAQPLVISVRNPAGRTSFRYDFSALDAAFEQFGAALGQALESAQEPSTVSRTKLYDALGETSVAFFYPGEFSPALVGSWLHVETLLTQSAQCFVLSAEDDAVTLYLLGEELSACPTQLGAETLEQLLQSCTPDGSFFAFEDTSGLFSSVDALSLLPAKTPELSEVEAVNPCEARFSDTLASNLGFNPYGDARYSDDAGNITYTETGCSLSVLSSGLLQLRADAQLSRFQASSEDVSELVECARALLGTMASGSLGDARLYLSDVSKTDSGTVCSFDYCLAGLTVSLSGGHAAEVRFEGTSAVSAQLLLRTYTATSQTLSILPPAQAAAIVKDGAQLHLGYVDTQNGLSAGWQS